MPPALERRVLRSLRRLVRVADTDSSRLNHQYRITGPQLACLQALRDAAGDSLTLSRLAGEMNVGTSTANGVVDRLERKGLVVRRRDTVDRRRVAISLTDTGRQTVETAPSPLECRLAAALHTLSPEERHTLCRCLERVAELVEQGAPHPTPASPARSVFLHQPPEAS